MVGRAASAWLDRMVAQAVHPTMARRMTSPRNKGQRDKTDEGRRTTKDEEPALSLSKGRRTEDELSSDMRLVTSLCCSSSSVIGSGFSVIRPSSFVGSSITCSVMYVGEPWLPAAAPLPGVRLPALLPALPLIVRSHFAGCSA